MQLIGFQNQVGAVALVIDNPESELSDLVVTSRVHGQPELAVYVGDSLSAARAAFAHAKRNMAVLERRQAFTMTPNGS